MKRIPLLAFLLAMVLSACAGAQTKYYISATSADGGVGNDSTGDGSASAPWATITKWKSAVFTPGNMTTGDEVVISGLIREPDGVVLNAIQYTWGSRYMKGFRQWLPSDGFPGSTGTQTVWQNNIQRARLTSAQALTGTITDTGGVGTINISALGIPSDQVEYLTWRYRDNIDKFGRHFGHRLYQTVAQAGVDDISSGDGRFTYNGTTLTMDLNGADTTAANWEICKRIGAILQFQNWQGFGPDGPALVQGVTLDRAVNTDQGAYLISMENCYRTGIRDITGYDGGHHVYGITGYSNDGNWMRNVVGMGQYGLGTGDSGGQGGNSMTCSPETDQANFTWNATNQTLSGTYSVVNGQQPLIPGQTIVISSGTGTSAGQTAVVDYSVNATTFRLRTPITATNGASDIGFTVYNICRNHSVEDFDYHLYPPLGLTVTAHVAAPTRLTRPVCLSNPAPAGSTNCEFTNNRYRRGRCTIYPDGVPTSPSFMQGVVAGGRRTGWTTNVESPEAYPLLIQDVKFINVQQFYTDNHQDVAYDRCSFDFHPSVRTVDGPGSGAWVVQAANSGANVAATRILFTGCEMLLDLGGSGAASSVGFSSVANGNNQTGWTLTAPSTLTKAGGLSNCPIPRPGTIISTTSGTGVTAAPYTVVSATATTIVVAETIVGTNGAADIAFDVCMAEFRFRNSTIIATGLRRGATVTSARMFNYNNNSGTQGRYRGPLMDVRGCIIGFDRLVTGITNILCINDQLYTTGQAFGDRRRFSGNVYLNISTNEFSDVTAGAQQSALLFLNRSAGVDRTGYADNSNVLMNAPVNAAMFPGSYPYTNPPLVTGASGFAGVNGNQFSGQPGGYQYGRPLNSSGGIRGRPRRVVKGVRRRPGRAVR